MDGWEAVLRLLAAAALGGAIGFEREASDQAAGFRTHILVALGSALFTMVGAYGLTDFQGDPGVTFDPGRIAAQIVTGIGFLGAGAIIQSGIRIRGLTTAAAMWATAAIGMAVGFGYWVGAIATTVISLMALYVLKAIGSRRIRPVRETAQLNFETEPGFDLQSFEEQLQAASIRVDKLQVRSEGATRKVMMSLTVRSTADPARLIDGLAAMPGVTAVEWES